MNHPDGTSEPPTLELAQLRARVAELEASKAELEAISGQLRESREKYRSLIHNLTEAVLEYDSEGRILYASSQVFGLVGLHPEEVVGRSGFEFVHPDDLDDIRRSLEETLERGHTYRSDYRIQHKAGHYVCVGGAGRAIIEEGRVRIIGTLHDISERKQAEQTLAKAHDELAERVKARTADLEAANAALRDQIAASEAAQEALAQSESKLAQLLENLPDFVIVVDRQAKLLYANRAAPGVPVESLVGSIGFSHIRDEYLPMCREALQSVFRTGHVISLEMYSKYDECLECRLVPLKHNGEILAAIIICTDITARKHAEEKVLGEQELLRRLFNLQERERKLLSHEIHDGFVQDVVGAKMLLESAMAGMGAESGAKDLGGVQSLLGKAVSEARRMISELRPLIVDEQGVVESINYLLSQADVAGELDVTFHHDLQVDRFDPILEGTVFRIAQEALNNVRRHSESTTVEMRLSDDHGVLRLTVSDRGVGFDPDGVPADRFGLRGIYERARLFGGKAIITSAPGQGTEVAVELPLGEATADKPDGAP